MVITINHQLLLMIPKKRWKRVKSFLDHKGLLIILRKNAFSSIKTSFHLKYRMFSDERHIFGHDG